MQLSSQEKKRRIALDFNKKLNDILLEIREIYPNVSSEQIQFWENSQALEFIKIDDEKCYFRCAVRNLFRIDNEAKNLFIKKFGDEKTKKNVFLQNYLPKIIETNGEKKHFLFKFRLKVMADAVPDGEKVRCWLPFPQQNDEYQQNIKLISSNPVVSISHNHSAIHSTIKMPGGVKAQVQNSFHSTIYFERTAKKGVATIFEVKYEFETLAFLAKNIKKTTISPQSEIYIAEEGPHIVFSDKIRKLSMQIIGNEQDKYKKAKKIFTWISENIVWTVAREYSTIDNISEYVCDNLHGDCGQITLLFITLCRLNGVPARWLSGFMLYPNGENLHDWAEIFIENIGWLPVDTSFGMMNWAKNDNLRYFYFGNMDAYRLIINNGISDKLYPAKIFFRSETIDFQRGEVEWHGGNIYFDKWDYEFEVEEIKN